MTFCIITKNERENLKNCLEAIRHFAPKADIKETDVARRLKHINSSRNLLHS